MLVHNYRITPRMCGKDYGSKSYRPRRMGSPPHVRERQDNYGDSLAPSRITPACAGKTNFNIPQELIDRDHPRMCGKDLSFLKIQFSCRGSPPHVRERLYPDHSCILCGRITPACAGKTGFRASTSQETEDHPRMCGKDRISPYSPSE